MNEEPNIATGEGLWRGVFAIVILTCLAFAVWRVAQTRPPAPGFKGAPAHAPLKPVPAERASENSETFLAV